MKTYKYLSHDGKSADRYLDLPIMTISNFFSDPEKVTATLKLWVVACQVAKRSR
jgi:hypothetical protein